MSVMNCEDLCSINAYDQQKVNSSLFLSLSLSVLVVSVDLQVPAPVAEGADLTACATLTFLGDTTALECDITVNLVTTDGTKAGGKVVRQSCQKSVHHFYH